MLEAVLTEILRSITLVLLDVLREALPSLIVVAVGAVALRVKPLAAAVVEFFRQRTSPEQFRLATLVVQQMVKAVERDAELGRISDTAHAKLSEAVKRIDDFLKRYGIDLPEDQIVQLIESALHDGVHQHFGLVEAVEAIEIEGDARYVARVAPATESLIVPEGDLTCGTTCRECEARLEAGDPCEHCPADDSEG